MNTLCRAALMAVLAASASGFSAVPGAAANGHCQPVGGSVFTNFVDPTDAVGPVSGDLAGAVSVHPCGQWQRLSHPETFRHHLR
jgi:hypothetical protein